MSIVHERVDLSEAGEVAPEEIDEDGQPVFGNFRVKGPDDLFYPVLVERDVLPADRGGIDQNVPQFFIRLLEKYELFFGDLGLDDDVLGVHLPVFQYFCVGKRGDEPVSLHHPRLFFGIEGRKRRFASGEAARDDLVHKVYLTLPVAGRALMERPEIPSEPLDQLPASARGAARRRFKGMLPLSPVSPAQVR